MTEKIDRETKRVLEQGKDGNTLIPFVVTLKQGTRPADVLKCEIEHDFPAISAASCKMTARQALDLAGDPSIERIEYDGQMHALRDLIGGAR